MELSTKDAIFLANWDSGYMMVELLFIILLVILAMLEVYQAFVLRLQYLELENLIEWVVIVSASVTICMKPTMVDITAENSAMVRGVAAIGICAAWLELIFIAGRYPFRGGDFSIMFYNIIKKTFRYVVAMGLMVCGFAFAFMVIHFGLEGDIFQNPLKSVMTTLTMVLGEFNFGDMYAAFGSDTVSRGFAMVLLLLMIIIGTITMVNLFIVVVISDLTKLQEEVFHQNLVNMAMSTILVEAMLPRRLLASCQLAETVLLCGHTLCPGACTGARLVEAGDLRHIRWGWI